MNTSRKTLPNGDVMTVNYGIHRIGSNKQAYFTITSEIFENSKLISCGCQHDQIAIYFPELAQLIQWHLCWEDGTPFYYFENGEYWFRNPRGDNQKNPYDYFKKTVVFGCRNEDRREWVTIRAFNVEQWMRNRLPEVQMKFKKTMRKFGVNLS